jgi:hypothetical protein
MVREARFLWSDPFDNPSDVPADDAEEWDDLDLSPLHRQSQPSVTRRFHPHPSGIGRRNPAEAHWPPHAHPPIPDRDR